MCGASAIRSRIPSHNDNTRRAYGRALGSFFAFLEDGGRERVQNIGPLDVPDYLEAAKANGLSTATLK
jgi:site-specific recombinase XerD